MTKRDIQDDFSSSDFVLENKTKSVITFCIVLGGLFPMKNCLLLFYMTLIVLIVRRCHRGFQTCTAAQQKSFQLLHTSALIMNFERKLKNFFDFH